MVTKEEKKGGRNQEFGIDRYILHMENKQQGPHKQYTEPYSISCNNLWYGKESQKEQIEIRTESLRCIRETNTTL